ncbi:MAG: GNAT family N-acetyltransferase, partial [Phycisphaerae bacterium]|nr:GNAT family N-acetyltransferase [Phycisphaerae bacterium]
SVPAPPAEPPPWQWRDYEHFTEAQLGEVILATYEQSLDCPLLKGLRTGEEIVAGHRTTGVFCPGAWWIVDTSDGAPAGCILANDVADERTVNVVYLGVVPACRGQGLAAAMLQHARSIARARGKLALTLAVDTRNTYAHRVYVRAGFVPVARRGAYAACATVERRSPAG